MILRDLDILQDLAKEGLTHVSISLTTLQEDLRRLLEPRTATVKQRLRTIEELTAAGIPVNVMLAPIIPGLTDHEILPMAKKVSELGATSIAFTIVRLNGAIGEIFTDWIRKTMPDKADKVLNQIESCHGGTLNDSRYGHRMRGEGKIAEQIRNLIQLARLKYFKNKKMPRLNTTLHEQYKNGQYSLF
jgi:DNA repair photolyase